MSIDFIMFVFYTYNMQVDKSVIVKITYLSKISNSKLTNILKKFYKIIIFISYSPSASLNLYLIIESYNHCTASREEG